MSKGFWGEAIRTSVHVLNRSPRKGLDWKTPYEVLFGRIPDVSYLRVFGCRAWAHTPGDQKKKWDANSRPMIHVGYELGSKAYRLWNPVSRSIVISASVRFDETQFPNRPRPDPATAGPSHLIPKPTQLPPDDRFYTILPDFAEEESIPRPQPPGPPGKGKGKTPQQTSMAPKPPSPPHTPSPPQSPPPPEDSSSDSDSEPGDQSDQPEAGPSQRRSTRVVKPVTKLSTKFVPGGRDLNAAEAEEAFLNQVDQSYFESVLFALNQAGPNGEPSSYKEAMESDDRDNWQVAIDDEFASLQKMKVWEVVPRPKNRTVVGCKWVFRKKLHADSTVSRYKARLVAKGYTQVPGMDFSDTHAPVTRLETIRFLLSLAVQKDWEIRQIDVKTAYLYGDLDEEIFMEAPEGLDVPEGYVLLLKKVLYSLKQAGRQWYEKLKSTLIKFACVQVQCEPNTFVVRKVIGKTTLTLVLPVYVDDLMPIGDKTLTDQFEDYIGEYFDISPPTDAKLFLGIQLERDRVANPPYLELSQYHYAQDILQRLEHDHTIATTPMVATVKLVPNPEPKKDANPAQVKFYQTCIGMAMWLMLGTRPDIAFAVGKLARFSSNPSQDHLNALKRLFDYICWSADFGLRFIKQDNPEFPICHVDADFAGDPSDRISVTGYVFMSFGTPFSWSSKKQPVVATSTAEAEYTAMFYASQQAFWIRQFSQEIGFPFTKPLEIFSDSQAALSIASGTHTHGKTKHLDVKLHKIREYVNTKHINLNFIRGEDNKADILTKPLAHKQFHKAVEWFSFSVDGYPDSPPDPGNSAEEQEVSSQLLEEDS